jgi:hypothetical protein
MRKWGWPLMAAGLVVGLVGFGVVIAQSNSYSSSFDDVVGGFLLLAISGCLGNLGFFLLLFGIVEERIYEAQGITKNGVQWLGQKIQGEAAPEREL